MTLFRNHSRRYRAVSGLILIIAATPFCPTDVRAERFSDLVVFGDSRYDTGNAHSISLFAGAPAGSLPASPPYFEGRWSNGPVWVERLAELLGVPAPTASELGGTNYAWAGATTGSIRAIIPVDDMDLQVERYLSEKAPQEDQLFVLLGGGNDSARGQTDMSIPARFIGQHVSDLAEKGARNFLVANMPHAVSEDTSAFWGRADEFNAALAGELSRLRGSLQVTIYELDVASLIDQVVSNPESFGFSHIAEPACSDCGFGGRLNPTQVADNPDEFLLWDQAHFSARTHQLIGDAAFEVVVPEPSTVGLFVCLFTIVVMFQRTRFCLP